MKDRLKVAGLVVLALALAYAFTTLRASKGYALRSGTEAPGFRLPALTGAEVDLASLRGQVVVVNFWATWCPPCVDEMPSLEKLHRALGAEGLVVLGVSVDEDEAALKRFVTQTGVTFKVLRDPGGRTAAREYHTTGYPETFVIDRKGVLHESFIGPAEWATPGAIDHFRDLLRSASTAPIK
jgi:cytochrome c biogenesis protein CcmG, thiol:disulfide interchange protein DsbE